MIRALVLGATGQLGHEVVNLAPSGVDLVACDATSLDITDRLALEGTIRSVRATVILNCAAFTRVDDAEADPAHAMAVNGYAPGIVGEIAAAYGARVVHLSTDYVFSGTGGAPHVVGDTPAPINVYGLSKLEGERRLLAACNRAVILRTAWVHGGHRDNFVRTAVRMLTGGSDMDVVDDQFGTPTRAAHLARAVWLAAADPLLSGILHFTDAGVASWYDVAMSVLEVLQEAGCVPPDRAVRPASSARRPRPAPRPRCAVLDKHASWERLCWTPPHWRVGVATTTRELLHA